MSIQEEQHRPGCEGGTGVTRAADTCLGPETRQACVTKRLWRGNEKITASIGGNIIHYDYFVWSIGCCRDRFKRLPKARSLVVYGNDDRDNTGTHSSHYGVDR